MMKSNQYPEESPPGYYTRGSTCLAGDAHRHIAAHARAVGPKARVHRGGRSPRCRNPWCRCFSNQMARRFMLMPAAPKMQNHSTAYRKGKGHMTPCLMVHPREMRAMKASTRGAQAIHFGALAVFRLLSQCRVGKGCDVEGNRDEVVQATVRTIRLRGCTRAHPVQMQTSSPPCRIPRCVKRLS